MSRRVVQGFVGRSVDGDDVIRSYIHTSTRPRDKQAPMQMGDFALVTSSHIARKSCQPNMVFISSRQWLAITLTYCTAVVL